MDLIITGKDLTINILVKAARHERLRISFAAQALKNMKKGREFASIVTAKGGPVYGLSVGVGSRKTRRVPRGEMIQFNNRMIHDHVTAQGAFLPQDVARASTICLINSIAAGRTMIRSELAIKFAERLCSGPPLKGIPMYGGTGVGDVAQLPLLVLDLLDGDKVGVAEGLPLIAQSSIATAAAAVAIFDAKNLLNELCVVAAIDIEGFAANPSPYYPISSSVRPYKGYRRALEILNYCLNGSNIFKTEPRHLQEPLSFRSCAVIIGAAYDIFDFCKMQINIELNAHQQNPLSMPKHNMLVTSGHFDMQAISSALDYVRIALAPVLTAQTERSMKMLQASETGLTAGLEPLVNEKSFFSNGLSELAWALQGMCTEAKTLIQPVSAETPSATQAEGIEDRMNMANLSARRLSNMVELGFRCTALSAIIGCQAMDLRGNGSMERFGPTLKGVHQCVRSFIPALKPESSPPHFTAVETFVNALKHCVMFEIVKKQQQKSKL